MLIAMHLITYNNFNTFCQKAINTNWPLIDRIISKMEEILNKKKLAIVVIYTTIKVKSIR